MTTTQEQVTRVIQRAMEHPSNLQIPESAVPFQNWPWELQRWKIESMNKGRTYKPLDIRTQPRMNNAQVIPEHQKVCPCCRLILRKPQMIAAFRYAYGGGRRSECPRCGTLIEV